MASKDPRGNNSYVVMILLIVACVFIVPPIGIALFIAWIIWEMKHAGKGEGE